MGCLPVCTVFIASSFQPLTIISIIKVAISPPPPELLYSKPFSRINIFHPRPHFLTFWSLAWRWIRRGAVHVLAGSNHGFLQNGMASWKEVRAGCKKWNLGTKFPPQPLHSACECKILETLKWSLIWKDIQLGNATLWNSLSLSCFYKGLFCLRKGTVCPPFVSISVAIVLTLLTCWQVGGSGNNWA